MHCLLAFHIRLSKVNQAGNLGSVWLMCCIVNIRDTVYLESLPEVKLVHTEHYVQVRVHLDWNTLGLGAIRLPGSACCKASPLCKVCCHSSAHNN